MSDLQVALFALGAIVILGVLSLNLWQGRPTTQSPAPTEPIEPQPDFVGSGWHSRIDTPGVETADLSNQAAIDPVIDGICPIRFDLPIPGEVLLAQSPKQDSIGGKVVLMEGLDIDTNQWRSIDKNHLYQEVNLAVQLANRNGPLSQVECSQFTALCFHFAQAVGGNATYPDSVEMLEAARSLDAFAERCDQVLTLTLKAREKPWALSQLVEVVTHEGFVEQTNEGKHSRFLLMQDDKVVLTLVVNRPQEPIYSANLLLYLPAVNAELKPFELMQEITKKLKFHLVCDIVDDEGQMLHELQLKTIATRLEQIYQLMNLQGIPAGSDSALRLFSE